MLKWKSKSKSKRKVTRAGVERAQVGENVNVSGSDYVSELPECILHNILSFLQSREAARMSILSNRWRQVWSSFPQLDVDYQDFQQHGGDWVVKMKNHIDGFLQKCVFQRLNIHRFRLCLSSDPVVKALCDTWIEGALARNVKELHIEVKHAYRLPPCVLSATTLTVLTISGCKLKTSNNIELPLLQKLSLERLHVSDQMLKFFISSCPLIEELSLIGCKKLHYVNISARTKLQKFHLNQCKDLRSVKIAVPMLQS